MNHGHRGVLSGRVVVGIRMFFVVLGLASLVLGYMGLGRYLHPQILQGYRPVGDDSPSNLAYYDVELFLLQSTPLSAGGRVPWELQIARFSAPSVALYTLVEFAAAIFATRIHRTRLRRARGHTVVYGSARAAKVLADRLRANGSRVIVVESTVTDRGTGGLAASPGDPSLQRTLREVGAHRAARLYACDDRGEENAQIADAAEQLRLATGFPRRVYVLIPDLEVCAALRARRWSLAKSGARHMGFFNPEEIAGQTTVRTDRAAFAEPAVEIAIAGTGPFAQSLLVEFARQWLVRGRTRETLTVLLIGPYAAATASELLGRYAFLAEACRIEPHAESLETVLGQRRDDPGARRLTRLYLCQEDENEALATALDLAALLQSTFAKVVVRLDRMAGMATAFHTGRGADGLVDALGGRLRLVDVTYESCDPEIIEDDLAEWLARACHQRYVTQRLRAGARPGGSAALKPWEELSEEYRSANRDHAMDIGRKLAEIGCLISPRRAGGPAFEYVGDEVEMLSELEHERWVRERTRLGWRRGERDERRKLHPDLVPWHNLPESLRALDYEAIRDLPAMLADAGLAIVRGGTLDAGRSSPTPGSSLTPESLLATTRPLPEVNPAAILPAKSP